MATQAITRLKKARARMLVKHPFFATIMMGMPMVETTEIPTAATDMKTLFVNPDFIDSLDDDLIMFVIAHEVMHTALMHGLRRTTRDPMRWNIAADYSINLTLKASGFKVWDQALLDDKYLDKSGPTSSAMGADKIYNLLTAEEDAKPKPKPGQGDPQEGQGQPGPGQPGGQPQPGTGEPGGAHHSPMLGDLKDTGSGGDPIAEDQIAKDIQQRVAQAATIARMTGNMSGDLERFVNSIIDPQVPWQDMLRHLMTKVRQDQESWQRRNRRFAVYLPSRHSVRMGPMVLINDTSGSISPDEIRKYNGEAGSIAEDLNPERIVIIHCDSSVKSVQEFESGEFDVALVKPKGGGGTDMRVALTKALDYEPAVVVLFTDGYTPWPTTEPDYPLIVCCTTNKACPVGDVVRI